MSIFSAIAEAIVGTSQQEWDSEDYQFIYCREEDPELVEPLTYSDHVSSCANLDDSDSEDDSDLETSSSWFSWLGL
jgi:hypothetical protein